eukprot:4075472-Pleurochrysis_carterae.AAC.1
MDVKFRERARKRRTRHPRLLHNEQAPRRWKRPPSADIRLEQAHRLKNKDSALASELRSLRVEHMHLLTGTPLQARPPQAFARASAHSARDLTLRASRTPGTRAQASRLASR